MVSEHSFAARISREGKDSGSRYSVNCPVLSHGYPVGKLLCQETEVPGGAEGVHNHKPRRAGCRVSLHPAVGRWRWEHE